MMNNCEIFETLIHRCTEGMVMAVWSANNP